MPTLGELENRENLRSEANTVDTGLPAMYELRRSLFIFAPDATNQIDLQMTRTGWLLCVIETPNRPSNKQQNFGRHTRLPREV